MKNLMLKTSVIGKYLFAVPMIIFGVLHFVGADAMAVNVPIPGGVFWVYFTGLALLLAGISIIIKKYDDWASFLLAIMLVVFVLAIHLPGAMAGGEMAQIYMASVLKDLALAGGALMYLNSKK